jgi:hypothetical protein
MMTITMAISMMVKPFWSSIKAGVMAMSSDSPQKGFFYNHPPRTGDGGGGAKVNSIMRRPTPEKL